MYNTENATTDALRIFGELANVFESVKTGGDLDELTMETCVGRRLANECLTGKSVEKAIFLVCSDPNLNLTQLLFGSLKPNFNETSQEITASDGARNFQVVFDPAGNSIQNSQRQIATNTIILHTDFKIFTFYRISESEQITEPFATFSISEICDEIALVGSIWAIIFPAHHAIISRTISYTFAQNIKGTLFSTNLGSINNPKHEENLAYNQLNSLNNHPATRLLSLEKLRLQMQSSPGAPKLLSEHKDGEYTLRQYSPQRSSIFDFGEQAGELNRSDVVVTYNAGNQEFHREFFVAPRDWESCEEELRLAVFDILHMLAIRRTKLFRTGFASRVYNVLLPPALLEEKTNAASKYALFPCINLYRTKRKGFRRTVSVTFIVFPIEARTNENQQLKITSRVASLEEIYGIKDELLSSVVSQSPPESSKKYVVRGPIKSYVKLTKKECSAPELLRFISKAVLQRALASSYSGNSNQEQLIDSVLYLSNMESKIATISLLTEWIPPAGYKHPWERWLASGEDKAFCNNLFRTLFYWDFLKPYCADASSHALEYKEFNIGDSLGADMAGMTLFNPQESLKFVFYPKSREKYPNHSIIRWMTWQIYIDSALASLQALIYKFHPAFESRADLHSIIDTLDEMIQEFVEFYDLDLRDYFYRKEYEKIRNLMKVDSDYKQLLSKFASCKEEESLREQRLINKFILSLTIATVTITVVSTIAQMGGLSKRNYLIISLALSVLLVGLAYRFFDPLRRFYKRVRMGINRLFEG